MRRFLAIICAVTLVGAALPLPSSIGKVYAGTFQQDDAGEGNGILSAGTAGGVLVMKVPTDSTEDGSDDGSAGGTDDGSADGTAGADEEDPEQSFYDSMLEYVGDANKALQDAIEDHVVMALVYLSDRYDVRESASSDSKAVVTVKSGQQVQILEAAMDENFEIWEHVKLICNGKEYTGYVRRENLACSDEIFLKWEDEYGLGPSTVSAMTIDNDPAAAAYADVDQFPASYQEPLRVLKTAHPNWTFVKMDTGLDWNTVVANEMVAPRNLVPDSFPTYMKDTGRYSAQGWTQVSEGALKYYLDPRNWLTYETIFQFEQLTYNATYHTEAAVQAFLNNTFMAGMIPNTEYTFAHAFWEVGASMGVSPFHLASRVYQEQGQGNSPLISGNYPGYEGYYNYFNVKASGKSNEEVYRNGLEYARNNGWTDGYLSIQGGANVISKNYILAGQDTLYLQKFDVEPNGGLYYHQYMQNVCAPSNESKSIRKLYESTGSVENTFVFKIPVYSNMPEAACPQPTISYTVTLTPPEGYTDATVYLDGIAYPSVNRDGRLYVEAANEYAKTATMYKYDANGVPVGMYVWELTHDGAVYTVTALPELENLLSYHGFAIRITGKSGIRFKSGISVNLRNQLLQTGVAGYYLKEYGTLAMNNARRNEFPMIKGGEKILNGLAYGIDESGILTDQVFATVDDRYQFTSVLTGLPADQYKTEFAFRGYAVLTKNGQDVILYGPVVAKSIYNIAEQFISMGYYEEGSAPSEFLKTIIKDADAVAAQQQAQSQQPVTEPAA